MAGQWGDRFCCWAYARSICGKNFRVLSVVSIGGIYVYVMDERIPKSRHDVF